MKQHQDEPCMDGGFLCLEAQKCRQTMHLLPKVPQMMSVVLYLKNPRDLTSWALGLSCQLLSHGEVVRVADACVIRHPDSLG